MILVAAKTDPQASGRGISLFWSKLTGSRDFAASATWTRLT